MVRIVKYPKKQIQKMFRCRHCEAEWWADASDYEVSGYENEYYRMTCPICGWQLHIDANDHMNYFGEKEVYF